MGNVILIAGLGALVWALLRQSGANLDLSQLSGPLISRNPSGGALLPTVSNESKGGGLSFMADISKWAAAIKQHEGWFPNSRSYRNNNPGNLKYYKGLSGAIGADKDGFAVFQTEADGMAALERDLTAKVQKYPSYSILQIMTRYLGGDPKNPRVTGEGDPFAYAASVAKSLGASINATLGELFGSPKSGGGVNA